jgi:hypothetical protein
MWLVVQANYKNDAPKFFFLYLPIIFPEFLQNIHDFRAEIFHGELTLMKSPLRNLLSVPIWYAENTSNGLLFKQKFQEE